MPFVRIISHISLSLVARTFVRVSSEHKLKPTGRRPAVDSSGVPRWPRAKRNDSISRHGMRVPLRDLLGIAPYMY